MYISSHHLDTRRNRQGFALIATISVMVLLVMVALAMLSLSSLEARSTQLSTHQAIARANARLALMQAINELQKHTGPDQRVTARAAILETGTTTLANRNWLGVWSTTVESGDEDWPVIGKAPSSGSNTTPYSRPGAYEDLRHTQADLTGDAWKAQLHRRWLVSQRSGTVDVTQALDETDGNVIEIIGKGTLGKALSGIDYDRERVLVQKVDVGDTGAYAWHIADNNQKASIDPLSDVDLVDAAFEASPRANPALVKSDNGTPFSGFTEDAQKHPGKLLTYLTAPLTQGDSDAMKELLGKHYNHFTTFSPGLFTNTLEGGLRNDLTPLLLAKKGDKKVDFSTGQGSDAKTFSSSYPIIPGPDHGVLGPSFGALRNWALNSYSTGNNAETTAPSSAIRIRPTDHWPHGISDGAALDGKEWAESAPKIHPIMTDARWHYYFSHHNKRIRTHIIPRVCLWNPYNKDLTIPALTVMMPNPFFDPYSGNIDFFPEETHVTELKKDHPSIFGSWDTREAYKDENDQPVLLHKLHVEPFPEARYLAFTLKSGQLAAGECQVFSPEVTSAGVQAGGVKLQEYNADNPSSNVLSSSMPQGTDHYYFDHSSDAIYKIRKSNGWRELVPSDIDKIDLSRIFNYQPSVVMQVKGKVENFPFILKSGSSSSLNSLYTSASYPTLQLVHGGSGGASPGTYFDYKGEFFGHANQQSFSFGNLETFAEAPLKDTPVTHQVGAKLLWLDESATEGNAAPYRVDRWTSDHMAYNISPVANWNVRAQLTTRSPASQCASRWFMTSMGSWLVQFAPLSPQNFNDQPSLNAGGTAFVKNPFGAAANFSFSPNVVLFDLPSSDYGVLSLAKLRHAMLSPYSWNPSYIIGHSLRDMHAPAESTAHSDTETEYSSKGGSWTRWDYLIGGSKDSGLKHGPYAKTIDSQGLLQIGNQAVTRSVRGKTLSSSDEILAYDIAYEVNQNLWDRYFISGMPLSSGTQSFIWDPINDKQLWNRRYQFNFNGGKSLTEAIAELSSSDGINTAFWANAEILNNKAAFNVNSTSVEAWITFLSGTLGIKRPLEFGELDGTQISFARHRNPSAASDTSAADPDQSGAWVGARQLSDDELRDLATNIVLEVKKRGPFVSIADFVNRRLTDDQDDTSSMGTLDAVIKASKLNDEFENNPEYQSTSVVLGTTTDARENNLPTFEESYRYQKDGSYTTVQPSSQAWGMPGFLTQSDILESIAPALSVRGDTFTIRAYGESSQGGDVKSRAWIEATIERSPQYVDSSETGNLATDVPLLIEYSNGAYSRENLNDTNQRFGRKFIIRSLSWLNPEEI